MAPVSKRSKSVSWAPDENLCQVRLFLSEDAPVLFGDATQDHLQPKASWLWHSNCANSIDSPPPGFETNLPSHEKDEISHIPVIIWQCPNKFVLNPKWSVVCGEESTEVEFQNQRQSGVLEAVYPRPASIPPNPFFTSEAEVSDYNDCETPCVPITAIEEEELDPHCLTIPVDLPTPRLSIQISIQPQTSHIPVISTPAPSLETGFVAAAFASLQKSNDSGNMIDQNLLLNILNDPNMVKKLISECGTSEQTSPHLSTSIFRPPPLPFTSSSLSPIPASSLITKTMHMNSLVPPPPPPPPPLNHPRSAPFGGLKTTESFPVNSIPMDVKSPMNQQPDDMRDMNYYKNLIQCHGGEKLADQNVPLNYHDNRESFPRNNTMMRKELEGGGGRGRGRGRGRGFKRDSRQKITKPCVFFNTPKGCKHGVNCLFQHDPSSFAQRHHQQQHMDGRSARRTKYDGEFA